MRTRTLGVLALTVLSACGGGGGGDDDGALVDLGVFPAASIVIGQADFVSNASNRGGTVSALGMNTPSLSPALGSLYVTDPFNNRVLGYQSVPTTSGAAADFVLGQADFTSSAPGVTASALNGPRGLASDGVSLAVCDSVNNRVLIWNSLPTANVPADVVVGQTDFTSSGFDTTASTLRFPRDAQLVGGRLIVLDGGNDRVLIWNSVPTTNGTPADLVLGQADFTSLGTDTSATRFDTPVGLWSDGTRLAVADFRNHRVLMWNSFPTTNGQAADVVLGQADFTSSSSGGGASGLNSPWDVGSNGTQLFVVDSGNSRVLVHNAFPTSNNRPADAVIGQSDFAHTAHNDLDQDGASDATASARTFDFPTGVLPLGDSLLVVDSDNSRLLVFEP